MFHPLMDIDLPIRNDEHGSAVRVLLAHDVARHVELRHQSLGDQLDRMSGATFEEHPMEAPDGEQHLRIALHGDLAAERRAELEHEIISIQVHLPVLVPSILVPLPHLLAKFLRHLHARTHEAQV